jgi:hypothetical protein
LHGPRECKLRTLSRTTRCHVYGVIPGSRSSRSGCRLSRPTGPSQAPGRSKSWGFSRREEWKRVPCRLRDTANSTRSTRTTVRSANRTIAAPNHVAAEHRRDRRGPRRALGHGGTGVFVRKPRASSSGSQRPLRTRLGDGFEVLRVDSAAHARPRRPVRP